MMSGMVIGALLISGFLLFIIAERIPEKRKTGQRKGEKETRRRKVDERLETSAYDALDEVDEGGSTIGYLFRAVNVAVRTRIAGMTVVARKKLHIKVTDSISEVRIGMRRAESAVEKLTPDSNSGSGPTLFLVEIIRERCKELLKKGYSKPAIAQTIEAELVEKHPHATEQIRQLIRVELEKIADG